MTYTDEHSSSGFISILVLRIQGIIIGVDERQVSGLRTLAEADPPDLPVLNKLLGIPCTQSEHTWVAEIIVRNVLRELIIQKPENIIIITPADIKPVPAVIRRHSIIKDAWGFAVTGNEPILLVDLASLIERTK